jgi:L-threonylcarbamoyladenylate synthase
VLKIFAAKNRPHFNPLIVHTHALTAVEDALGPLPAVVYELAAALWPGPMTLLLPRGARIPELVTAGHPRVAIRIPDHPLTLALLQRLPFPLAAPSANPFGYISPTTAQHVADQLGDRVGYILDGGPARVGIESTIIGLEADGSLRLYRRGGQALESIQALVGPITPLAQGEAPQASGMLKSHYAPHTPLILGDIEALAARYPNARLGVLAFQRNPLALRPPHLEILSPDGDLGEAAHQLFAAMRRLDQAAVDYILAEPVPDRGLGRAINDRLRRAEAERKG